MNREILFRGKRVDGNGWAEGGIALRANGQIFIAPIIDARQIIISAVDPDTVGQYTGFKDRNGTRIFEGDVVDIQRLTSRIRALIKWTDCTIGIFGKGWRIPDMLTEYNVKGMTVVGNIYDNPELVEV